VEKKSNTITNVNHESENGTSHNTNLTLMAKQYVGIFVVGHLSQKILIQVQKYNARTSD